MSRKKPWRVFSVPLDSATTRLDQFMVQCIQGISRRKAQQMIVSGEITVDNKRTAKGVPLRKGSQVEVWVEPVFGKWPPRPCAKISIDTIYVDESIVVVNKPAGIPSTPLTPDEEETLAGALVARFPDCTTLGRSPGDGGLVQRLDRETSGVVVAARSQEAHDRLVEAGRRGQIEKKYLALVHKTGDKLPSKVIWKLCPVGPRSSRMRASTEVAHPLETTDLRLIRDCGETLLVEATIHRGQRHQIRVHLASTGFPIVGDARYSDIENLEKMHRLQLHAYQIHLIHPTQGGEICFQAPLPDDFLEKI